MRSVGLEDLPTLVQGRKEGFVWCVVVVVVAASGLSLGWLSGRLVKSTSSTYRDEPFGSSCFGSLSCPENGSPCSILGERVSGTNAFVLHTSCDLALPSSSSAAAVWSRCRWRIRLQQLIAALQARVCRRRRTWDFAASRSIKRFLLAESWIIFLSSAARSHS